MGPNSMTGGGVCIVPCTNQRGILVQVRPKTGLVQYGLYLAATGVTFAGVWYKGQRLTDSAALLYCSRCLEDVQAALHALLNSQLATAADTPAHG